MQTNNTYRVTGTYIAMHQSASMDREVGTRQWYQEVRIDEIVDAPDTDEAINIACRNAATRSIDFNTFVGDDVEQLTVQPATAAEIEAHESYVALMQMATSAEPLFDLDQWGKLIQTAPEGADSIDITITNMPQGATDAQLATIAEALAQIPPRFDPGDLIMMTIDEMITTKMLQALPETELATIMGALNHAAAYTAANAE